MTSIEILDLIEGMPGETVKIMCSNVQISGKKNVDATPSANVSGPVEAQTLSFENNQINISGAYMVNQSGTMDYGDIMRWYKHKYIGTNKLFLKIRIKDNLENWPDMNGSTTLGIPVILKSFNIVLDTKDSNGAYLPTVSLSFSETA